MLFSAHITPEVKEAVYNSDMAVMPRGCTSKLQPCDVSWNKPFKDIYRDTYMMTGCRIASLS
jgi:hypothetical protein